MSELTQEKDDTKDIRVFQLNDERAEFDELEIPEDVELQEILDSELVLYFVQPAKFKSFIWTGSEASTRMKFIAAKTATKVRDSIGPAIGITTVDEGDETHAFNVFLGLEEEVEITYEQTGPVYEGRGEDDDLIAQLPLDKLLVILEKIGLPTGFTREYVIQGKDIYAYQEYFNEYLGEIIKERKLYRLKEKVPDGTYVTNGLIPRLIMRFNRVVCTELIKPLNEQELEERRDIEQKIIKLDEDSIIPFV